MDLSAHELVVAQLIAASVSGLLVTLIGRGVTVLIAFIAVPPVLATFAALAVAGDEGGYIDFGPGDVFGPVFAVSYLAFPGWAIGCGIGTGAHELLTHLLKRQSIH